MHANGSVLSARFPAAGAVVHVRLGDPVVVGQPLVTLHLQAPGPLAPALVDVNSEAPLLAIDPS